MALVIANRLHVDAALVGQLRRSELAHTLSLSLFHGMVRSCNTMLSVGGLRRDEMKGHDQIAGRVK